MGYLKYFRKTWNDQGEEFSNLMRERKIEWRKQPVSVRLDTPTRIDRARSIGYKAKKGFIVVRQKVLRGGRQHADIKGGRRTAAATQRKTLEKNYQQVAEERANKKYPNCEVLGSYFLASDGKNYWYEIILLDRDNPVIAKDKNAKWITGVKGRVHRGLTSAGRKARGLRRKGIGSEKTRPSLKANKGRH